MDKFITISEAAEMLDVSVTTIYSYFKRNILTMHKKRIGRKLKTLINKSEVDEVLRQEEMMR